MMLVLVLSINQLEFLYLTSSDLRSKKMQLLMLFENC